LPMNLTPPQSILDALAAHEAEILPITEIALQTNLRRALASAGEISKEERKGAWAETAAFHFVAADTGDRSPWGSYFRPIRTTVNKDGTVSHSPNAGDIDASVLGYWEQRASTTSHPVLRARYADLVWEFGKRVPGADPVLGFAWVAIAIDAYLDTVQQFLIEHEPQAWRSIDRAIELALAIPDVARVKRAKTALFGFYREQQRAGQMAMWWMPDEIAQNRPGLELNAGETQELLQGLEMQLSLHANHDDSLQYDPSQILSAADRLIRHRRRLDQPRQAVRTMKVAGAAIEQATNRGVTQAQTAGWLEEVLRRYHDLAMHDEAGRLEGILQERKAKVAAENSRAQSTLGSERDTWLERLIAGTSDEAFGKMTTAFLVSEDLVRDVEGSGEEVGAGGSSNDFSDKMIRRATDLMTQKAPLLSVSFERLKQKHALDVAKIVAFLGRSSAFEIVRRRFLQDALQAWLAGDAIKSIYLLIPEIEAALRHVLLTMGGIITKPCPNGHFEPLDAIEILHTTSIKKTLDRSVRLHLLSLFGDGSGGSLGNKLARGTASYDQLDASLSNWMIHGALVVAKFAPGTALDPMGKTVPAER